MSSGSFSHIDFPSRQRGFISMRIALRPILISLAVPMFLGLAMDAAGGVNSGPGATTSSFGQFAVTQPPHSSGQTATLLPDGRWLLIGGESGGKIIGALTILGNDGVPASNQILPTALAHPRSGHTATVLPDGTVLILGGNGADGSIVTQAEVFDPATGTVTTLPDTGLQPRTRHAATVLTDGMVLVSGGVSLAGAPVELAELWNPETLKAEPFVVPLNTPRSDLNAALLSTGQGLVWGGRDSNGAVLDSGELYDPKQMSFSGINWWDSSLLPSPGLTTPQIQASLPAAATSDVPEQSRVAVRFNNPMQVQTINDRTITLVGPSGPVAGKVVAAESGLLAFVTPKDHLAPGATYTVLVNGVADASGQALPFSTFSFSTHRAGSTPSSATSSAGVINIKVTKPTPKTPKSPTNNAAPKEKPTSAKKVQASTKEQSATPTKAGMIAVPPKATRAGDADDPTCGVDPDNDNDPGQCPPPPPPPPPPPDPPPPTVSVDSGVNPPSTGPVSCGACIGDPVDLASGLFTEMATDLYVPDVIPIVVERTYRQNDSVSRAFGIGTNLYYSMSLFSPTPGSNSGGTTPTEIDLIKADGGRIPFIRQGNDFSDAVWVNTDSPTIFHGAVMTYDSSYAGAFVLTLKDKTVYKFAALSPNQLTSITDSKGNTLTITLSGGNSGNISQITSPNGRYVQFSYDASSRITQATDNAGRLVQYGYDGAGNLQTVTDADTYVERYDYDANGRLWHATDKRSNVKVTNLYDANGRIKQQTLADGAVWLFNYTLDANGRATQTAVTNPRLYITQYNFNANLYPTTEIRAVGRPEQQTYTYERDATNLLLSVIDPLSRKTGFTYDSFGNVTSVTRLKGTANATTERFTYHPVFRKISSYTDALNHTTKFRYDPQGNLVAITDPLNHSVAITPNDQGQPAAITDALGHSTQIGYVQGDVATVTDAIGRTTRVYSDSVGRTSSVTDPLGNQARYSYDAMNRLQQVTDPLSGLTKMTYDHNGNLLTVLDPRNGTPHQYAYFPRNFLQTYTDPLGKSEGYTYDKMGNLLTHTDRNLQLTQYAYDPLNRLKTITYNDASTVTLVWDTGNRLKQIVDSANGTITRDYDGLDRLTQETTPQGQVTYDLYDGANRLKQMTVVGSAPVTYDYDDANRLQTITQGTAVVTLNFDDANRRSNLTLPNGVLATYGFDNANQLQSIAYANGATSLGSLTYGYDSAGRRSIRASTLDQSGLPTAVATTAYNAANQLSQWGAKTLSYDDNGNLKSDGTSTYTWNARNQLVSISGGVNASFSYDALGRRRSRGVNGTSTNFLYDGLNLVRETSGSTPTANYLTGFGIDETYARTASGATQSYLTDALGSVVGLTNSSGAITTGYNYDSYGNTASSGTANANALQYAGRENDGATGLYYNRARYYSTTFGRFISDDPIGLLGGLNRYAYVGGNPVSGIDPYGLENPGQDFANILRPASTQLIIVPMNTLIIVGSGGNPAVPVVFNQISPSLGQTALEAAIDYGKERVVGKVLGESAEKLYATLDPIMKPVAKVVVPILKDTPAYKFYKWCTN